jgi:uncharacterized membrane protein YagU involved in acid resistance
LDAIAAIILFAHPVNLHNTSNVFRYIASGLFGKAAYDSGFVYPILGLILHFIIALIWSAVYILILHRVFKAGSIWAKIIFLSSLIWIIMNGFVMPLCGLNSVHYDGWSVMQSYLVLVICISLPICLIAEKRRI